MLVALMQSLGVRLTERRNETDVLCGGGGLFNFPISYSAVERKLKAHMDLLHDYNDVKDATQAVLGQLGSQF